MIALRLFASALFVSGLSLVPAQVADYFPDVTPETSQADSDAVNLNAVVNRIADEQGVPVGSWGWILGGVAPWSGSSGTHASYGWLHDHKLTPSYVRAVLANYGHRRTYYANAPFRQYGYAAGGRPRGWKPELPGDNPDGSVSYLTANGIVVVSGPEVEHFWLSPLFSVIRGPDVEISALGRPYSSRSLARILVTLQVRSLCGQIREKANAPYPWGYGDRGNSRILDTVLQAYRYGCIEAADAELADAFIRDVLLPFYERPPGVSQFNLKGAPTPAGRFSIGLFNGLHWLMPVFHDASVLLPDAGLRARFAAIVARWAQWCRDMDEIAGSGQGYNAARLLVDGPKLRAGAGGKPLPSIAGLFSEADFKFDPWRWDAWAFRAADVAAEVSGDARLRAARDAIYTRHSKTSSEKQWMVGADREYAEK